MRPLLSENAIHPSIHTNVGGDQTLVNEVKKAISENAVVVVGMRQNPVVKSARKLLDEQNVEFTYLEYGSYLSMWRPRLAIKMWSGFVTFPQIFINGTLIGGCAELKELMSKNELATLLAQSQLPEPA